MRACPESATLREGNIVALTDGNGNALTAFVILDRGYTGHEHLLNVGLINMNGRMYDPKLHRFLSPDNFVQDPYNTQNFNRYGYVMNNPLMYVDKDGNLFFIPILIGALIGAGIAGSVYTVATLITGQNWNWSDFGKSLAFGAVGGAFSAGIAAIGTNLGAFGQSLGFNMLSNIASNSATQLAFGQDITWGSAIGMVAGGFLGAKFGNFTGVSGSAIKNIGAEFGFNIVKGGLTGAASGAVGALVDGNNVGRGALNGAKIGAISGATISALNITTMGAAYKPNRTYGNFGRNAPVYRRGTFFTRWLAGSETGVAIGRNLITHQLDEDDSYNGGFDPYKSNHFLRAHETGHYQQQIKMGFGAFYAKTMYQYLFNPGFINVYNTPGTLEYEADLYAKSILGYEY